MHDYGGYFCFLQTWMNVRLKGCAPMAAASIWMALINVCVIQGTGSHLTNRYVMVSLGILCNLPTEQILQLRDGCSFSLSCLYYQVFFFRDSHTVNATYTPLSEIIWDGGMKDCICWRKIHSMYICSTLCTVVKLPRRKSKSLHWMCVEWLSHKFTYAVIRNSRDPLPYSSSYFFCMQMSTSAQRMADCVLMESVSILMAVTAVSATLASSCLQMVPSV